MAQRLQQPRDRERASERVLAQLDPLTRPLTCDRDLDPLMERIGDARYVLLGEASHGTSEFYTWRTRLSQRLLREKGFRFLAVEGDWPDCYRINRYVRSRPSAGTNALDVLHAFERWPTWMWANREVEQLTEWLAAHNAARPEAQRVGFYGLDVYSLWDSMRAVIKYLDHADPAAGMRARRAYECFAPFAEDAQEYGRATVVVPTSCEDAVVRALTELRQRTHVYRDDGHEAYFDAEQNALIAKNAQLYYRTMVRGGAASWNIRDSHMAETLERLMAFHGPDAKAVVWAHNTHVGDARSTNMADSGEHNLGQLLRVKHARDGVVVVGFASHRGSVIAGHEWGAPLQRMHMPAAEPDSYEDLLHRCTSTGTPDKLLLFDEAARTPELLARRGHRAVGVVYRPRYEHYGNYVPTVLPQRYDALLFIDESRALAPLHVPTHPDGDAPDTYPSGM